MFQTPQQRTEKNAKVFQFLEQYRGDNFGEMLKIRAGTLDGPMSKTANVIFNFLEQEIQKMQNDSKTFHIRKHQMYKKIRKGAKV